MATSDELQNTYRYARMRSLQGGSNADQAHISGLLAVQARVQADTEAQLTRPAKAAMYDAKYERKEE